MNATVRLPTIDVVSIPIAVRCDVHVDKRVQSNGHLAVEGTNARAEDTGQRREPLTLARRAACIGQIALVIPVDIVVGGVAHALERVPARHVRCIRAAVYLHRWRVKVFSVVRCRVTCLLHVVAIVGALERSSGRVDLHATTRWLPVHIPAALHAAVATAHLSLVHAEIHANVVMQAT